MAGAIPTRGSRGHAETPRRLAGPGNLHGADSATAGRRGSSVVLGGHAVGITVAGIRGHGLRPTPWSMK